MWFGNPKKIPLIAAEEVIATQPIVQAPPVKMTVKYTGPIPAPITKGQHVADLIVTVPGGEPRTIPLLAGQDAAKITGFARLGAAIDYYILRRR